MYIKFFFIYNNNFYISLSQFQNLLPAWMLIFAYH